MEVFLVLIIGIFGIGFLLSALFNWELPLRSTSRAIRAIVGIILLFLSFSYWKINYTEMSKITILGGVMGLLFALFDPRKLHSSTRKANALAGLILLMYPVFEKIFEEYIAISIIMGIFGLLLFLGGVLNWGGVVYWSGWSRQKSKTLRILAIIGGAIILIGDVLLLILC